MPTRVIQGRTAYGRYHSAAFAGGLGVTLALLLFPDSQWVHGMVLLAGVVSGYSRNAVWAGVSISFTLALAGYSFAGLPLTLAVIGCLLMGRILRGDPPIPSVAAIAIAVGIAANLMLRPPFTDAGWAAAFAVTYLVVALVVTGGLPSVSVSGHMWITVTLAILAGAALLQIYGGLAGAYANYEEARLFESILGSSNSAAWKASVIGMMSLGLALHKGTRPVLRVPWALVSAVFLAAPLIFASRGSLLATLVGVGVFIIQYRKRRGLILVTAGILSTIAAIAWVAANQKWFIWRRLADFNAASSDITSGRVPLWKDTVQLIEDNPVFGVGVGRVADELMAWHSIAYAHNFPMEVLAQLGVFLGIAFLVWVVPGGISTGNPYLPGLVSVLVVSLVEPSIVTPVGAVLYVALILACRSAESED